MEIIAESTINNFVKQGDDHGETKGIMRYDIENSRYIYNLLTHVIETNFLFSQFEK